MHPAELTDEQVVVETRERSKELYSEIIRRYEGKLSHYLRKFIRDPDELEDVLQAVFIKSYENLYGFDAEKKFSSWIYRIAHNEAINHLKKRARLQVSIDDAEFMLIDHSIDLEKVMDMTLAKQHIEMALAQLKAKYRDVLIWYFLEQKTYEEISDILHIPTSTVGTLLARGKKMLKTYLETYGTASR